MSVLQQTTGHMPATKQTTLPRAHRRPSSYSPAGLAETALYALGRTALTTYMQLMLDVDICWHAPLPKGPTILAANHPTTTDPFYLLTLVPEPVSVLVAAGAFKVPIFGNYLRATGHVPALRSSGGATVDAVVEQIEAGRSVAVFPEGALSPLSGGVHQPHSGVARVALRTGAPVIPIGIGLQRRRIRVAQTRMDGGNETARLYLRGPYALTVGRPLRFGGDVRDREHVRAIAGQIMDRIEDLARESERRIPAIQHQTQRLPKFMTTLEV